jgi:hypothetical protein
MRCRDEVPPELKRRIAEAIGADDGAGPPPGQA